MSSNLIPDRIKKIINPALLKTSAYQVKDATGLIKLDAMENPFSLSNEVKSSLADALAQAPINRYSDPDAKQLTSTLRGYWAVPEHQDILLGNGSDELIQLVLMSLLGRGPVNVMSVEPSFVMYKKITEALGLNYIPVDLKDNFEIDDEAFLNAISMHQPSVIFLAQPNNPTGNLFSEDLILRVLKEAPGLVVIDEAYGQFSSREHLYLLEKHQNLMIMRTLSKIGLAGLRIGALIANKDWLCQLNKVRLPYNINVLSQIAAVHLLSIPHMLDDQVSQLTQERQRLMQRLSESGKWQVFPSQANFVLIRSLQEDATQVYQRLIDEGILVKLLHGSHGLLNQCLRLTVGLPEENNQLLASIL